MARSTKAGMIIVFACIELIFLIGIAELLYPGYSVSQNYISDLGVGPSPSREIFTLGVLAFGLLVLLAASRLYLKRESRLWLLFAVSGIGAVGVAVFNEDYEIAHTLFSLLAFLFGNLAAVYVFIRGRSSFPLFAYLSLGLGLTGIVALALLGSENYLGLGPGGMERVVFYSGTLWALAYGARLSALEEAGAAKPSSG